MNAPKTSVLIGCYGDFPDYSLRAVESVLDGCREQEYELLVGCNSCCASTIKALRLLADSGKIDALIESRRNLNKDRMMRLLIDLAAHPYVLWIDDDSHVLPGWAELLQEFISRCAPFDCAGHIFYWHKDDEYRAFLRQRPWYLGENAYLKIPDHQQRTWFATGGFFLARTEFLRKHDFPDRGMLKRHDDILLGDLISQHNGRLIPFDEKIMEVVRISDGDRRGIGEEGYRSLA